MKKWLVLLFLISVTYVRAQEISYFTLGVKISGLALHPQKKLNESVYRWKLDKKGHFVGFVGVSLTSSYHFNPYLGVKLTQTTMPFDCAGKFASVTLLGLNVTDRVFGFTNEKHNASMSIGPLLYLRKGWLQLKGYEPDESFIKSSENKKWQHKFVWYGGQAQYDYYFKPNQAVSVNFFPGYPYIYSFAVGQTVKFD
jgi:hypothetical protein